MNRRNILLTSMLAGLLLHGLPSAAEAADRVYRVGVLAPEGMRAIESFKDRLRELGWMEGRNIRSNIGQWKETTLANLHWRPN